MLVFICDPSLVSFSSTLGDSVNLLNDFVIYVESYVHMGVLTLYSSTVLFF